MRKQRYCVAHPLTGRYVALAIKKDIGMSCGKCSGLVMEIRNPQKLTESILLLRTETEKGNLKYLGFGSYGQPFSQIANGKNWGDFVNNYFVCKLCGQVIHLRAETYHGSGGKIAAVESILGKLYIDEFAT